MGERPIYLIDENRAKLAELQVALVIDRYEGTISFLEKNRPEFGRLFTQFEEVVEGQMFSLLDEIEEKIARLPLRVLFDNGTTAPVTDLQVFPRTQAVSFRIRQPSVDESQFQELNNIIIPFCCELISSKKLEAFPRQLLGSQQAGDWISVRNLCGQAYVDSGEVKEELFVCWLSDPKRAGGYAVIIFFDDETKWSMAAHYNRERLFGIEEQAGVSHTQPAASAN